MGGGGMRGELMAREMGEQPSRLSGLVGRGREIAGLAKTVVPAGLSGITIVARGSSDHAATYGRYLLEAATGKPVSLAAPSLHTLYRIEADYSGQLVVAVSQSGATPEIVDCLRALCSAGGSGLAITNDPSSPLASAAGAAVDLDVGEERSVPATKTVTAQFVAFALLASALGVGSFSSGLADGLAEVPAWVEQVLGDVAPVDAAACSLVDASHLIVVARGFMYGAALETALKIKETCSLLADGYSAADLRHGPIAAVTRGFPVVALNAVGPAHPDVCALMDELRARGARVLSVSADADADLMLPADMPEALAPIAAVVRGQQLACALALRLGYNPDTPEGLSKVTVT